MKKLFISVSLFSITAMLVAGSGNFSHPSFATSVDINHADTPQASNYPCVTNCYFETGTGSPDIDIWPRLEGDDSAAFYIEDWDRYDLKEWLGYFKQSCNDSVHNAQLDNFDIDKFFDGAQTVQAELTSVYRDTCYEMMDTLFPHHVYTSMDYYIVVYGKSSWCMFTHGHYVADLGLILDGVIVD